MPDTSPQFRNSRVYLESLLRQSPPIGNDSWIGHRAAIDGLPYQLDPALLALEQPRQRILMADAVGWCKTIETAYGLQWGRDRAVPEMSPVPATRLNPINA